MGPFLWSGALCSKTKQKTYFKFIAHLPKKILNLHSELQIAGNLLMQAKMSPKLQNNGLPRQKRPFCPAR
jgi:hypothetical protein